MSHGGGRRLAHRPHGAHYTRRLAPDLDSGGRRGARTTVGGAAGVARSRNPTASRRSGDDDGRTAGDFAGGISRHGGRLGLVVGAVREQLPGSAVRRRRNPAVGARGRRHGRPDSGFDRAAAPAPVLLAGRGAYRIRPAGGIGPGRVPRPTGDPVRASAVLATAIALATGLHAQQPATERIRVLAVRDDATSLIDAVRDHPDDSREVVRLLLIEAGRRRAGSDDSVLALARRVGNAYAAAWEDSFPLTQVTRFARMDARTRAAKLASDS